MNKQERVDILIPPLFTKSGESKDINHAIRDHDWLGTFNLWIVTANPKPSLIYQRRSPHGSWAPNLLDVTAGGYYQAGESIQDGLREVEEELGIAYQFNQLIQLGRKLYVGHYQNGHKKHNVVDIFMIQDDRPLTSYTLQQSEVAGLVTCPIHYLHSLHQGEIDSFIAQGIDPDGNHVEYQVNKESFPKNWDHYHYKITLLADRYFKGESNLVY